MSIKYEMHSDICLNCFHLDYEFLLETANKEKYSLAQYRVLAIDRLTKMKSRIISSIPILLPELKNEFYVESKSTGILIYENNIVSVTAEKIELTDITKAERYIWKERINKRKFSGDIPEDIWNLSGDFATFLKWISYGQGENALESLLSIYGFLLHTYKDLSFAKAVIFYDANLNDRDPNGRTGKSLLTSSLQYLRPTVIEDGKSFKPSNQFTFSRVKSFPNLFIIDDVKRSFQFDIMFTLVTSDFTFERKSIDREVIPFERSPKIVITSNFDVPGQNQSHRDRRLEYVISSLFDADTKPWDISQRDFFTEWDEAEWQKFDSVAIKALQYYLQNGVIPQEPGKKYYVLKKEASSEFVNFADTLELNTRYDTDDQFKIFYEKYPKHAQKGKNTFTRWLKMYADFKNWNVSTSHSNKKTYIEFLERTKKDRINPSSTQNENPIEFSENSLSSETVSTETAEIVKTEEVSEVP